MDEDMVWVRLEGVPGSELVELRMVMTKDLVELGKNVERQKLSAIQINGTWYAMHYKGFIDGEEAFFLYPYSNPNPLSVPTIVKEN